MKDFKKGGGNIEHYSSFTEVAAAFGCKPVMMRRNRNPEKIAAKQKNFKSKHICVACGMPMEYIGGNIMCCMNKDCDGIKVEHEDADGNKTYDTIVSFNLLNETGEQIANNIF